MTDSEPDWANYDSEKSFTSAERESNRRWARLRCASLRYEPPGPRSSDPLAALIDAEDEARGLTFRADHAAAVARLQRDDLSRDVQRRLVRRLLLELERLELFGSWLSAVLRERGIRTRTWKRSVE